MGRLGIALLSLFFFLILPIVSQAATIGRPPTQNYTGLIGYWTLDGNDVNWSTGVVTNRAPGGTNGQVVGMSTSTSPTMGRIGQALNFDRDDDYVSAGATFVGSEFSYSFWIKTPFASNSVLGWGSRFCGFSSGYFLCTVDGDSTGSVQVLFTPYLNVWTHITFTSTSTGQIMYINGVQAGTAAETLSTGQGVVTIGVRNFSSFDMSGSLDDVRIYDRVLSADEAKRLYNAGASKFNTAPSNPSLDTGLTGWWTFDGADNSSGTIMDRSGRGNHASMRNMATATAFVIGKKGQAIALDGVNDYVDTTRPLSNFINAAEHTISLYAYFKGRVPSDGDRQGMVSDTGGIVYIERDNLLGFAESMRTVGCETSVLRDYWIQIIQVHKGGIITTHYTNPDGSRSSCSFAQGDFSPLTGNLRIGISSTDSEFEGLIDDVRVYNRGISAAEVDQLFDQTSAKMNTSMTSALTGPGSGLVGWWTFDGSDMTGGTVMDRSGRGNSGSTQGMATSTAFGIGKRGQAVNFDGVDDYIRVTNSSNLNPADITIAFWMKPSVTGVVKRILDKGTARYIIRRNANDGVQFIPGFYNSTGSVPKDQWAHVAVTASAAGHQIYINGTLDSSNSTAYAPSGTDDLLIGGSLDLFSGALDDVRIYERVLSTEEVRRLYNQGR